MQKTDKFLSLEEATEQAELYRRMEEFFERTKSKRLKFPEGKGFFRTLVIDKWGLFPELEENTLYLEHEFSEGRHYWYLYPAEWIKKTNETSDELRKHGFVFWSYTMFPLETVIATFTGTES